MSWEFLSYVPAVPEVFNFFVRAGAKRVVVACTLVGLGGVTVRLIGRSRTFGESDMDVRESTTVDVTGPPKYEYMKRASLTIEPHPTVETWTLQLTFPHPMPHRVSIEVL